MLKRGSFIKNDDGIITVDRRLRNWPGPYQDAIEQYLTLWHELFEKAQEKDEFQFILALLRFKGIQDAGWDNFDNTIEAFDSTVEAANRLETTAKLNLMLWLYGHIVEASDHYEIICNMVNIAGGGAYSAWPFPKIKIRQGMREPYPNEKMLEIRNRCEKLGLQDYSKPFFEVLDKDLRNAVFHSDYSIHSSKVRFRNAQSFPIEYSAERTSQIINKAHALHEVIKNLFNGFTEAYKEPIVINTGPSFNGGVQLKAQVVIRQKHGVMAVKEATDNAGGFMLGTFIPGEMEKINEGIYLLPRSKRVIFNSVAKKLPRPLARIAVRLYKRIYK